MTQLSPESKVPDPQYQFSDLLCPRFYLDSQELLWTDARALKGEEILIALLDSAKLSENLAFQALDRVHSDVQKITSAAGWVKDPKCEQSPVEIEH